MKNSKSNTLKRLHLFVFCIFYLMQLASAQDFIVTGKVTDENNESLIGASITIKGTSTGTIADFDGNYSLKVSSANDVLVFSYIGFNPQEVQVKGRRVINVTLGEDVTALDEVVVVGYGVQKKSHLTGSVTKVETDGLVDIPSPRIDQALQGKIAGVQITNTTSEAGVAPQIRVRGMGSISASSDPLVVVDGFPISDGLAFVDMNDVESIEVLKDAASSAIYGSRGANGVILITTKKGDSSKPKYSFKSSWGFKNAYKLHPIMTADEYIAMRESDLALNGKQLSANEEAWKYIDNNTDWQQEGLQSAFMQNYQLSVSGGSSKIKYYLSANYSDTDGIMKNSTYKKMSVRSNIDAELNSHVTVGINLNPSYSRRERPSVNYIDFLRSPSWLPFRHTEVTSAITGKEVGSYAHASDFNNATFTREDGTTFVASPWSTTGRNPRSILENYRRFQSDYRMQSSAYINIKIADGLSFKSTNGIYLSYSAKDEYMNKDTKKEGNTNEGVYGNTLFSDLLSENIFNYNKTFGKHDISALLGFTAEKTVKSTAGIVGTDFPTDYVHTLNAATSITLGPDDTYTFKEEDALMSVLGRVNYSYADKYLVSISARTDGSSKFAKGKRWGWFPSASIGWRISEEPFLKKYKWLSSLKLRASWGLTGNNNIANYAYMNKLSSANYSFGEGNGTVNAGLANTSGVLANRNITWEQSSEYNYGFDLSVLDSRVNFTAEYYYSETINMLFEQAALGITGFEQFWNNIGKVRNKGFEFELRTHNVKNKNFNWISSFNISLNKNRLLDLGGESRQINHGERNESYLAEVGSPSIQYYGFKTIGIWNTQEEIDANPHHADDAPGGLRVLDANNDGVINDYDRVPLGDPFPDFTWGFNNSFKFFNFDLNVMMQGVHGGKIFNGDGYYNEIKKYHKRFVENHWINAENPGDGKTPYQNNGMKWELTDYLLEDASYWSIKDIVIGYKFPKKIIKKLNLNSLRFYASVSNAYVHFAKGYRGVNPEARTTSGDYASPLIEGYQRGAWPMERSYNFGIDINF